MLKEENWEIAKPQEWMPRTTLPTELLPRWRPPKLVWLRTTGSQIWEHERVVSGTHTHTHTHTHSHTHTLTHTHTHTHTVYPGHTTCEFGAAQHHEGMGLGGIFGERRHTCEAVEHWLERELDWEFLTTSIFQTQLAGCPLALP